MPTKEPEPVDWTNDKHFATVTPKNGEEFEEITGIPAADFETMKKNMARRGFVVSKIHHKK